MHKKGQYNIIVSDRCRQMLTNHIRFLSNKSPAAARKVKKELLEALGSLKKMPERYPFLDVDFLPPNKYHKMIISKRYLVLYQIKDTTVFIDHIIDCRQDYKWLIH